jgi:hypothetical protein
MRVLACPVVIREKPGMKPFIAQAAALALGALAYAGVSGAGAADKPYAGVTLNLA